jgi:hypothetical protein
VVHIFELGDVLRRGTDVEYEGVGRVSARVVLCWVWNHGDFLESRDGEDRCYEGRSVILLRDEQSGIARRMDFGRLLVEMSD